jgi:di/tricarboxylate transporter
MALPSIHAAAAILIAVLTFWFFARGRVRVELVCLVLIAILALLFYAFPMRQEGAYSGMEVAFGGFGHEALVAICCLMILGRGLVVTGALEPAARLLARLWKFSSLLGLLFSLLMGGAMSMVVNDTPVLVLTMPILLNLAVRVGVPASKTLMPMNCAILIGGMATTIGTSTNLLVVSIAEDLGLPRFGVFQFADVAVMAGLVALPYLWLVMPRLLPANRTDPEHSARRFDATLYLGETSSVIGRTLSQVRTTLNQGVHITHLFRRGVEMPMDASLVIEPRDRLHVMGAVSDLTYARDTLKATLAPAEVLGAIQSAPKEPGQDQLLAELVIGADSTLSGESVKSAQIADRYGVLVVGLYRPDRTFLQMGRHSTEERLASGDVLLVRGTQAALKQFQIAEGGMLLEGAAEMPRTMKAPLAVIIVAVVVILASLRLVPIAIASLGGAIAMLATGCVKFDRIGRALSAEVIVLVAASIALGRAILETGAADWLGAMMALLLHALPPAGVLAAIMAFAALLTNFASNTAAAAVGTPIAVSLARQLGIPPEPLVLAVLFGCNLCYATPVAYQTNILIMSAGGYQFRDYVRAGGPLVIIMIITLAALLVGKYGL